MLVPWSADDQLRRLGPPYFSPLDSVEPVECVPVQDFDPLSTEPDHSGVLESFQDAAHDFAARPQFVGEHLMGGGVGLPLEEQARSQPLVDPAESHVVNEGHQVREPLGEGVEHEDSEGWGLQDDLQEHASWDGEERQLRLCCSDRRIGDLAE